VVADVRAFPIEVGLKTCLKVERVQRQVAMVWP
jgi:hypothetical protein